MTKDTAPIGAVAGVSSDRPPFRFAAFTRVGFSDTDAQGIVYYGRYAPYFDVARVEYFRSLGILHTHVDDFAGEFVMRAFEIQYESPAEFDDALKVYCRVSRIGTSSMTLEYEVVAHADGRLLARSTQTMVYIDLAARRPMPVPEQVRASVDAFEKASA